MSDLQRM